MVCETVHNGRRISPPSILHSVQTTLTEPKVSHLLRLASSIVCDGCKFQLASALQCLEYGSMGSHPRRDSTENRRVKSSTKKNYSLPTLEMWSSMFLTGLNYSSLMVPVSDAPKDQLHRIRFHRFRPARNGKKTNPGSNTNHWISTTVCTLDSKAISCCC